MLKKYIPLYISDKLFLIEERRNKNLLAFGQNVLLLIFQTILKETTNL